MKVRLSFFLYGPNNNMSEQKNTMTKSDLKMPSAQEMLDAGVHFGHKKSRRHPKMEQYIFGIRNDVHIFDLERTISKLEEAINFLKGIASRGGAILFVGTKPAAKNIVKEAAQELGYPFVTQRWIGGTLTNFKTINSRLNYLKEMEEQKKIGGWEKFTKKERLQLQRKMEKMQVQLDGIRTLTKLPEAVFAADIKADILAVKEAKKLGIPVVALCDTNNDPSLADYLIPANDDASPSIALIFKTVKDNLKDAKAVFANTKNEAGEK